jgi:hypothetical protein
LVYETIRECAPASNAKNHEIIPNPHPEKGQNKTLTSYTERKWQGRVLEVYLTSQVG